MVLRPRWLSVVSNFSPPEVAKIATCMSPYSANNSVLCLLIVCVEFRKFQHNDSSRCFWSLLTLFVQDPAQSNERRCDRLLAAIQAVFYSPNRNA